MKNKEKRNNEIRFKMILLSVAVCICIPFLVGCGGAAYKNDASEISEDADFATYNEAVDDAEGMAEETEEVAQDETVDAEPTVDNTDEQGKKDASDADKQDKILVYEGAVSMDAIEFDNTVRAFKKTVEEYGGFLENEQSYGTGSTYNADSSYSYEDPRTFMATARIPSEKYQDFMEKTEGLGSVTESNSRVTNMTRQYGTLKAELEIYEAEYQRYLKMFDEVSDDNAMISIQEKLTELSLNIARTKSEMEVIDTDAAYSTVDVRIHEVAVYKENRVGFFNRLCDVLAESWSGMLSFFEGILFFLILNWYKFLFLFLIIFVIIKIVKKYQVKSEQKRQKMMQSYREKQQVSGIETVKVEGVKAETAKAEGVKAETSSAEDVKEKAENDKAESKS